MMTSGDQWRWSPDMPENPYPKYADARLDPSVRADVPFQETDDPESAVAWLDERLAAYEEECAGLARMEPRRSDMIPGVCSACGMPAERGPSGSWWHLEECCAPAQGAAATFQRNQFSPGGRICGPVMVQWTPEDMASPVITSEEIRATLAEAGRLLNVTERVRFGRPVTWQDEALQEDTE